ncbi:phosphatase PAP2 family protein [Symbioplanes lichenis]|uniref:phosphatase PAP2 family protein n=1 Tax=Symbioplanes lichenis TaxID=1629072 RepID=UPI002738C4C5|nr:phosphatase PAP2 family protein [Actinoplanes lichenis]
MTRALTQRSTMVRGRAALRELLLVVALFMAYKAGRILTTGHTAEAMANAGSVWDFERLLHLPGEHGLQQALLDHGWLVVAANSYYAYVHFPATAICLIYLYLRRRQVYLRTRRILAGLTAAALALHIAFPLAPPRLMHSTGMVDTGSLYGPAVYGPPDTDTISNQYAAMPSLHVGWALVIALALMAAAGPAAKWRWLWLAHPVITLLVVVSTGNHYWLDALVAVALLAVVAALVPRVAKPAIPRQRGPQSVHDTVTRAT